MVTLNPTPSAAEVHTVARVRALHSFKSNELAFEKGDVIEVVDREYKDWWKGQLKGRTGIFPVNYVVRLLANPLLYICFFQCLRPGCVQEPFPEPAPAELAAEAQQEAAVFSRAVNFDLLLTMLHTLDLANDNLADNEEIQELYLSCMDLRPKIIKLIDKYSQKIGMLSLCKI
jgi:signal transducing adaptor molecule